MIQVQFSLLGKKEFTFHAPFLIRLHVLRRLRCPPAKITELIPRIVRDWFIHCETLGVGFLRS